MAAIWTLGGAVILVLLTLVLSSAVLSKRRRDREEFASASRLFRLRREWLEAEFLSLAAESDVPKGVSWDQCDFENEVAFVRDRTNGQLCALVAITLRLDSQFSARVRMLEAAGAYSVGTAVFLFDGKKWTSDGRAIFNLNPRETIRRFRRDLQELGECPV